MKRVLAVLTAVIAACATPLAAQDKSYAEVRHLYEKVLLAAEHLEGLVRDTEYAELSWDLVEYGDRDLLARIPPKVSDPILRTMVVSNLGKAHARAGECPKALETSDSVLNDELMASLDDNPLKFFARAAFKNAFETYALCGALEQTEDAIVSYHPSDEEQKVYLAQSYAFVASALYRADRLADGERYFAKALSLVEALGDGEGRNEALGHIAIEQILVGRLDDAHKSLTAIDLDAEPDPGWRHSIRDGLFAMLANALASEGRWQEAEVALDSQSAGKSRMPLFFSSLKIEQTRSLDRDAALRELAELYDRLVEHNEEFGLVELAAEFAARGEDRRALAILDRLYEQNLATVRRHRRGSIEYVFAQLTVSVVLTTYVVIGYPDIALEALNTGPFKRARTHELGMNWGSLIGHARSQNDKALLALVEPTPTTKIDDIAEQRGMIAYFTYKRHFEEAERIIDSIPVSDAARFRARSRFEGVPHLYTELARYMMGVTYWDILYGRSDRHF